MGAPLGKNIEWQCERLSPRRSRPALLPDLLEALIAARAELEMYAEEATGEHYINPALNTAIAKAIGEGK